MATTTRKRKRKCKQNGNVESKSRIDDLNDTLLELIFTKLSPWKSLVISKCVSKRWNSIISNPDFTRQLTSQSFPFTLFYDRTCVVTEHPDFPKRKSAHDFIPSSHKFVGSTNDLVVAYNHINSQMGEYYVANLLTKRYVVVPIPLATPMDGYKDYYKVGIAGFVDGVSSTVNVSHRNNHGFRIVHINERHMLPKSIVQIYSSETDQWKTYSFDCHIPRNIPAITCNNKIHWLIGFKIVVIDPFNIDNKVLRVVKLPTNIGNSSSTLSICQNRLRIAQFEQTRYSWEARRIEVWEIEDFDDIDDNLGSNYLAKVKLVIDFDVKRLILKHIFPGIAEFNLGSYYKTVCCHPNDPQVIYFRYDGRFLYCNVAEKKM